jgi:hypothetical protein
MTATERDLLRALALMCYQYIGNERGVDHECIGAGEAAVDQLVKFGVLEPAPRGGLWTPAVHALMD